MSKEEIDSMIHAMQKSIEEKDKKIEELEKDVSRFLKVNEELNEDLWDLSMKGAQKDIEIAKFERKETECERLVDAIIKMLPLFKGEGLEPTNKSNLLDDLEIIFDEWERLENKENEEIEFASFNFVKKSKIKEKIKQYEDNGMVEAKSALEELLEE